MKNEANDVTNQDTDKRGVRKLKRFSSDEIAVFCEQIAIMMNGGIPVYEATYILYSEMEESRTKEVLKKIDEQVKENIPLYTALENTKAFPAYMVHMVRVGETTGKLEDVMRSLSEYYERESSVMGAIKSAIAYPIVLFAMMAVILLVLVWKILPLFERMFEELSTDVSIATENALSFGITAGRIIAVVTCILLLIVCLILLWYKTSAGERRMKEMLANFKVSGSLSVRMATAKFISSMSLMLASGMNIAEALELASGATNNSLIKEKIIQCREMYENNIPLDEALRETKLIVGMEGRMISVGAKSGSMDTVFAKLSRQYNEEISKSLSKISSSIETVLVVILSLLVGAVLLSVMIPLVSMISSIG